MELTTMYWSSKQLVAFWTFSSRRHLKCYSKGCGMRTSLCTQCRIGSSCAALPTARDWYAWAKMWSSELLDCVGCVWSVAWITEGSFTIFPASKAGFLALRIYWGANQPHRILDKKNVAKIIYFSHAFETSGLFSCPGPLHSMFYPGGKEIIVAKEWEWRKAIVLETYLSLVLPTHNLLRWGRLAITA